MAKHDDALTDAAAKRITAPDPNRDGVTLAFDGPSGDMPDVPRLRKVILEAEGTPDET